MKKSHRRPFRRLLRSNDLFFFADYAILVGTVTVALAVVLSALSGDFEKIVRVIGG